jgi:hypothetical protein
MTFQLVVQCLNRLHHHTDFMARVEETTLVLIRDMLNEK